MNNLKQKYHSIKLMYKMRDYLKDISSEGVIKNIENYYVQKTIDTLEVLKKEINTTEVKLAYIQLVKEREGLELMKKEFEWNSNELSVYQNNLFKLTYHTVGELIYPLVKEGLNTINFKKLTDENYISRTLTNVDIKEVNEDTWMMLFATKQILQKGDADKSKYFLVHLMNYIGLQEAYLYKSSKTANTEIVKSLLGNLETGLVGKSSLIETYSILLQWARKFGFNFRKGQYEELKFFIKFSYAIKMKNPLYNEKYKELPNKSTDEFPFDSHISWDKVSELK